MRGSLKVLRAAALCALLAIAPAACSLTPQSGASASASPSSAPSSNAAICGKPPCDRYLSRSDTRTLDKEISGHPVAAAIALHLAVSIVCGGILCVWGEGVTYVYVVRQTHLAAQNGDCLRVHVLPSGRAWQLVSLDASDQSPYCAA
jgi:hypothetical protein